MWPVDWYTVYELKKKLSNLVDFTEQDYYSRKVYFHRQNYIGTKHLNIFYVFNFFYDDIHFKFHIP